MADLAARLMTEDNAPSAVTAPWSTVRRETDPGAFAFFTRLLLASDRKSAYWIVILSSASPPAGRLVSLALKPFT